MFKELKIKKTRLKELRARFPQQAAMLDDWYDKELTYTSNAIEGNTLTRQETALVIEQNIAIGNKSLDDHTEAKNHYNAMQKIREAIKNNQPINENFVRDIHGWITTGLLQDSGFYSKHQRRVTGSTFIFPNPAKVPELIRVFGEELENSNGNPQAAFDAHLKLVSIHPFSDGNGRTARLLMNSMLIKNEYCPVNITPEQRNEYISGIALYQEHGNKQTYDAFMWTRLEECMNDALLQLDPHAPETQPDLSKR